MVKRYLRPMPHRPARPEAARRLIEAYDGAVERIRAGQDSTLPHPRPYPDLARYGFRWIKVHRYWFSYLPAASPVITNVFDEAGDIPTHISDESVASDIA